MNKLRNFALISVCLLCISAVVGTLVPFYVQAQDTVNNADKADESAANITAVKAEEEKEEIQTSDAQEYDYSSYVTETCVEDIPYEIIETGVDTIPKDSREIVSPGVCGKVRRTYLVKYDEDGNEVDRKLYTEFPMSSPVEEYVNVGVGGTVTSNNGTVYHYNYRKVMEATAYTYLPPYTTMTTATGETLRKGIVAIDPTVIPYHTRMFITGSIEYGEGIAEDCGGGIKGDKIDLAYMSYDECIQFGRRKMQVYILD